MFVWTFWTLVFYSSVNSRQDSPQTQNYDVIISSQKVNTTKIQTCSKYKAEVCEFLNISVVDFLIQENNIALGRKNNKILIFM